MTLDEALNHYKTGYKLAKAIGIAPQSIQKWKNIGKIPLVSQYRIQQETGNALLADILKPKKRIVRMVVSYE